MEGIISGLSLAIHYPQNEDEFRQLHLDGTVKEISNRSLEHTPSTPK